MLYIATLLLPAGATIDKLLRVQIAIGLFSLLNAARTRTNQRYGTPAAKLLQ